MTFGYPDWFGLKGFAAALACLAFAHAGLWAPAIAEAQANFPLVQPVPSGAFESGSYLPAERTLARGLMEAQERIAAGEYTAAIEFLQQTLEREEDYFVALPQTPPRMVGLKSFARRLIAELPKQGRAAYQLQQSAMAERELHTAIERAEHEGVQRVMRRYFHTPAGYQAALLVAQAALDRGYPSTATRVYEQLLNAPQAREQFGSQLALLAASGYLAAGNRSRAAQLLQSVTDDADLMIAGVARRLEEETLDALKNLDPHLATGCTVTSRAMDWCSLRGNAAGNAEYPGGPPHMRPRWRARVVNHPRLESYLGERHRALTRSGMPLIPAGSALAVGDVVLFKTLRAVVAVDWQTGKRIWETRAHADPELERLLGDMSEGDLEADMAGLAHPLDDRFWSDYLAAALSSDGQRVYTVRDLPSATGRPRYRGQALTLGAHYPVFGGITNRLSAYELASEGKLVWEIDGGRDRDGLAGAFFLGPPLAVDGQLYVLAEIKSAVYLLALDPQDGALRWKQSLVSLERGVQLDIGRAQAGPAPAYADGILVCPTSAGAVVAVDVLNRSLAWAHLYERNDPMADREARGWNPRHETSRQPSAGQWLDGSVLVADGKVVVTPRDSSQLLCLSLADGELLWQYDRADGLYVAGIEQGTVLLVGQSGLTGLRLADGTPAWDELTQPLPDEALAAGRGVLSEKRYYLPLTSGAILGVDLSSGKWQLVTEPAPDVLLGNLIWHRGAIVSQSPLSIDKFDQRSVLLERTNEALARNKDDAGALRDRGEIALAGGQLEAAADDLKRAHQINPADLLTQQLLIEALLELLATDYDAYRNEVALVDALAVDPQTRFRLLRLQASGLSRSGQALEAFDVLLTLGQSQAELGEMFDVSPKRRVRADRWLGARLTRLLAHAPSEDQALMIERLGSLRDKFDQATPFARLDRFWDRYHATPGAGQVGVRIVRQLLARQEFGKAELDLLRLAQSQEPEVRAATWALALQLLSGPAAAGDTDSILEMLSASDPNIELYDGRTVEAWLREWQAKRPEQSVPEWAGKQIALEVVPAGGREPRQRVTRAGRERATALPLRMEQVRHPYLGNDAYLMSNELDELIVQDAWGESARRISLGTEQDNLLRRRNDRNTAFGARLGHLVVVSLGPEAVAIDTRTPNDSGLTNVLWRHPLITQRAARQFVGRQRPMRGPFAEASQRMRLTDGQGRVIGALGPVTADGVVLFDGESLVCLEPWTGELLWTRTDVPPGCELFGDEQRVFVKPPHRESLMVYDLTDGRSLGSRGLPEGEWLLTAGGRLATLQRLANGETQVTVTDLWTQELLVQRQYKPGTLLRVHEPQWLAALEPTGQFDWIDAAAGQIAWKATLRPEPRLRRLFIHQDLSRLFVVTDRPGERRPETRVSVADTTYPLVTGNVYALDPASGQPLWERPAEVVEEGLSLYQPEGTPLLVFMSRVNMQQRGRGENSRLRLLCLDKQTGHVVVENDAVEDGPGGRFQVGVRPGTPPMVVVETPIADVRLTLTESPRDGADAEPTAGPSADDQQVPESALWKLGSQLGKQFLEALDDARREEAQPAEGDP